MCCLAMRRVCAYVSVWHAQGHNLARAAEEASLIGGVRGCVK